MTACDIIKLNEGRRNEQIVATVTYHADNGQTLTRNITRRRLVQQATQILNQYASYGMSYPTDLEEFFDQILEGLCNSNLITLYAQDYLSKKKAGLIDVNSGEWNKDTRYGIIDIVADKNDYDVTAGLNGELVGDEYNVYGAGSLLSFAEFDKVIKNVNSEYESIFNSYLDTVKAEQKAIQDRLDAENEDEDEEEEETKTLTPRPVKTDATDEDEDFDYKSLVSADGVGALTKRFIDASVIDENIGIKDNDDAEDKSMRSDAWKRAKKALTDNFVEYQKKADPEGLIYEYLLDEALDSMLIYEFKRALTETVNNKVTDEDIDKYIAKIAGENKDAYKKAADFYSAMNSAYEGILFAPKEAVEGKGYFYVKNIVLGYGENVKAYVKSISSTYGTDAYENESYLAILNELTETIYVNVSNIFYDPDDDTKLFFTPDKFFGEGVFDEAAADEVKAYLDVIKDEIKAAIADTTGATGAADVKAELALIDGEATDAQIDGMARRLAITRKYYDEGDIKYMFKIGAADALAFENGDIEEAVAYIAEGLSGALVLDIYKDFMKEVEDDQSFADEYEHTKALLEAYDVWFFALNDDGESSFTSTVNYLIYDEASFVKTFKDFGYELAGDNGSGGVIDGSAVGNYYTAGGEYWTVSEYGIHIMMVTYVPFERAALDDNGNLILDKAQILDYYSLEDNTVGDYARKILQEINDNTLYNIMQRTIVDLKHNAEKVKYEKFPKKYKDLTKSQ
jgi:hypothetical protein